VIASHEDSGMRFCGDSEALRALINVALPKRWRSHRFRFPSGFQLRPSLKQLSAARSIALRVLFKASQASDVGSAKRHVRLRVSLKPFVPGRRPILSQDDL